MISVILLTANRRLKMKTYQTLFIIIGLIVLNSCISANQTSKALLEGKTWVLTTYNNNQPIAGHQPTLEFEGDQISGSTGCNQYGSNYQITGETVQFEGIFRTEMACLEPAGLMEQENNYLDLLSIVDRFELDGDVLTLFSGQNGLLTFEFGQSVSVAAATPEPIAVPPTVTAVSTEIPPTPTIVPTVPPPASFEPYWDEQTGVVVYLPDSWVVSSITEGQYAIFQSYPLDKYIGGEVMEPNDTKCDLNIHEAGTQPGEVVLLWKADPLTEIVSQDEVVLNSGQIGQKYILESMGQTVVLVAEINAQTVTLACFGNLEPFADIALTLNGVE